MNHGPRIAFYITGHGFGHAARMKPVIDLLAAKGADLYVRGGANAKFFANVPADHLHQEHFDVGSVQADGLNVDPLATLMQYRAINDRRDAIIAQESTFLQDDAIDLVVGDITPLAFAAAKQAGVPGVATSHFTWDWIYEPYVEQYPAFAPLLAAIRADYASATRALRMPFAHDFSIFQQVEDVPLVVRERTTTDSAIKAALDVKAGIKLGVLSMGGMDWGDTPDGQRVIERLRSMTDWIFVLPPDMANIATSSANFRCVPRGYNQFHDLTAAADLIVAKAGGVTVSECIAYKTPLLYTFRNDFREDELLRPALDAYAHARCFSKEAFEAGAWVDAIEPLLAEAATWKPLPIDGANVIASRLWSLLA